MRRGPATSMNRHDANTLYFWCQDGLPVVFLTSGLLLGFPIEDEFHNKVSHT